MHNSFWGWIQIYIWIKIWIGIWMRMQILSWLWMQIAIRIAGGKPAWACMLKKSGPLISQNFEPPEISLRGSACSKNAGLGTYLVSVLGRLLTGPFEIILSLSPLHAPPHLKLDFALPLNLGLRN